MKISGYQHFSEENNQVKSQNSGQSSQSRTIHVQEGSATLHISKEGMERSMEVENTANETIMDQIKESQDSLLETYQEQIENSDKVAEAQKDMAKMVEIARRIANGDKVPAKDEKKLMEFSFELYQSAKSAAAVCDNKDPKEYESLFDDEEGVTDEKLRDLEDETQSTQDGLETEEASTEGSGEAATMDSVN